MSNKKENNLSFDNRSITLGKLLADDLDESFTQEESDRFIKSLVLYHNPPDVGNYLMNTKKSIQSILEKLLVSVVNYQTEQNHLNITPILEPNSKRDKNFTIQEVLMLMNISRPTIYSWFDKGLKQIKIGRRVFINENDLNEFLERNKP